ncbi:hypothetical protein JCM3766R1_003130 [Sporobolomyces carnicolor]
MQPGQGNFVYFDDSSTTSPRRAGAAAGPPPRHDRPSVDAYDPFRDLDATTTAQLDLVLNQHHHGGGAHDDDASPPVASTSTSTSSSGPNRKRGGRPRDKVWDLFNGDRTLALCKFCEWRSEHPKAFRMKTHVVAQCEQIPDETKQAFIREEAERVNAKKLVEQERLQQHASHHGTVRARPDDDNGDVDDDIVEPSDESLRGGAAGGQQDGHVPVAKKSRVSQPAAAADAHSQRDARTTVHHGPPPPPPPPLATLSAPTRTNHVTSNLMTPPVANSTRIGAPPTPARSPITCHVLDSTTGRPAPDMRIRLDRLNTSGFVLQGQGTTDKDGRCNTLLTPGTVLEIGIFKITFFTSEYFTHRGILSFYPFVEIPFEVKSPDEHYHIPCLLAPHSYTTYRGS